MKSFKVKTTGKDMLSDIVLAGYDAGVVEMSEEELERALAEGMGDEEG